MYGGELPARPCARGLAGAVRAVAQGKDGGLHDFALVEREGRVEMEACDGISGISKCLQPVVVLAVEVRIFNTHSR